MASNSFEPDTVLVKAHERKPPAKRQASSFQPDVSGDNESGLAKLSPSIFGAVGGAKAGVPGATMGGGIGEALRQLVSQPGVVAPLGMEGPVGQALSGALGGGSMTGGAPAGIQDAVDRILKQAAIQGASQVAGNALASGVKNIGGTGAMMLALKSNPELAATAADNGITPTTMGVNKLFKLIGDLGDKTRAVVGQAGAGRTLPAEPVANLIENEVKDELSKSSTGMSDEALSKLAALKTTFLNGNKIGVTAGGTKVIPFQTAHLFAQTAGNEAQPQFLRLANGERLELPSDPVQKLWKLAENKVLKRTLEHPAVVGPEYSALNAQQSKLIALKNLLAPDVNQQMGAAGQALAAVRAPIGNTIASTVAGAGAGAAVPQGIVLGSRFEHAIAGAALANPQLLSMLAIALHYPPLLGLIGQAPRAAAAAFQ